MKDEGLSIDVQYLERLRIPTPPDSLREEIRELAERVIEAQKNKSGNIDLIYELEICLNNLIEKAFQLTDDERKILLQSLPPRDPLVLLQEKAYAVAKEENLSSIPH